MAETKVTGSDPMLDIGDPVIEDDSIESLEYREYESQNTAALNSGQVIQIDINAQDTLLYPSKSYLLVEGSLTSTTEIAYVATTQVALVNNAIPFMFSQIRYMLNGQTIDNVMSPGQATTMKGMLSYGDDFAKAEGLIMCWGKDTTEAADSDNLGWEARRQMIMVRPDPVGTFSFCIPLKHLFGFCDDYHKVIYGIKHSLLLSPHDYNNAIFRNSTAPPGKITLTKVAWMIPHVMPAIEHKSKLLKQIEEKIKVPVAFRAMHCDTVSVQQSTSFSWSLGTKSNTESPRWILVAFQTNRAGSQTANPAVFDHVNVRNMYAIINSDRYPMVDMGVDFTQHKISRAYRALQDFKMEYYGIDPRESSNQVGPLKFKGLYPIFVIDVRKQAESLKSAVKSITLKVEFGTVVPVNTTAYAVIIADKILHLNADGRNTFNVVVN